MILEILRFPDPRLRRKGLPVSQVTPQLKTLAENMLETMYANRGIGLAAPQVGESHRLIVLDTRPRDDEGNINSEEMTELEKAVVQPLVLFNPQVVKATGDIEFEEGCLSVPTYFESVRRPEYVEVRAMDIEGKEILIQTDGLLAVCLQHEMDHLEGKLFIDRLSVVKSTRLKARIKKAGYPEPEAAASGKMDDKSRRKKEEFAL